MAQPELDRLIIENIADLDVAASRAKALWVPIEEAFFGKLTCILENDDWSYTSSVAEEDILWMAPKRWHSPEFKSNNGFKCRFEWSNSEKNASGTDEFLITQLLGLGYQSAGFRWRRENVNRRQWKMAVRQQAVIIEKLRNVGFEFEDDRGEFFLPVRIEQETLAKAFADESPELALGKIDIALQTCLNATMVFDALLAATETIDNRQSP